MKQKKIIIHLCTKEEMKELIKYFDWCWYKQYLRGYRISNHIYIVENCLGRLALLAHECGHVVFDLRHTWLPTIMNFSGLFRWFAK